MTVDPVPVEPAPTRERNVPAIVALAAAAVVVVGSLLPWARAQTPFGTISISGTDGDGVLTLFLALVVGATAGALVAGRQLGYWPHVVLMVAAVLAAAIGIYDLVDIAGTAGNQYAHVSAGAGVWVVAIASVVAIGAGVQLFRRRPRRVATD